MLAYFLRRNCDDSLASIYGKSTSNQASIISSVSILSSELKCGGGN